MDASRRTSVVVCIALVVGFALGKLTSFRPDGAFAQATPETPKISPVKALEERDTYFPGTEDLAPDEMRIIACGTGMPSAPLEALTVGMQGHTAPEQFGKVMSLVKPRLAVGYHFYNDFDTAPEVLRRLRKTYDGPVSLAVDYMVWNVTKDTIRTRMAAKDEEVWPSPALKKKIAPDAKDVAWSNFTLSGVETFPEVVQPLYDEINQLYGTDFKPMVAELIKMRQQQQDGE